MKRIFFNLVLFVLGVYIISTTAYAQTTQTAYVQSSAGGTASAGGFTLVATAGQPSPIGQAVAGQFTLFSGFIYTLEAAAVASITLTSPKTGDQIEIGKAFSVIWAVAGGMVAQVNIELSRDNGATYRSLISSTPNDGSEMVTIASPPVSDRCVIRVSDVQSGALPGTSTVFVLSPQRFASVGTSQTGGTAQTAYRMISFPARLDNASPQSVLEDNLGAYDNTKWRLFDYINSVFVEYPGTRAFEPGRALFLIVSTTRQINAGPGAYGGEAATVLNLVSGWNMIGNPYNQPVPVSALSLGNADRLSLITYEGSWSASVNSIEPVKGYAINVSSATTLTIRPTFSTATDQPLAKAEGEKLWSIQIKARCQEARDENNFVGLADAASLTWDALDLYEPPAIGEYVAVDFPHEDWAERADRYTTDFRPPIVTGDGQVWEMAVHSNIDDRVSLSFAHLPEAPPEVQFYLIDTATKIAHDLRANPQYTLPPLISAQEKRLQLVAGLQKFVENKVAELAPLPSTFELSQNYPNPFNPETAIRFGLPEKSRVTLKIFDLAGREVATLLANEEFPAGRHQRFWNGSDKDGRQVGSGVYFYRLVAGNFAKTMKLTLLR